MDMPSDCARVIFYFSSTRETSREVRQFTQKSESQGRKNVGYLL